VSDEPNLMRTKMESGPDRVTRIATAYMSKITVSFVMTPQQCIDFRYFYQNGANAGANWFDMPLDTGGGVAQHRVRFVSAPKISRERPHYRVSATLETDERLLNHV
jgi:hypothetical protein